MAGLMLLVLSVASAQAQTTVTASWDPNSDTYTAGYRVYYGTSSGSYQWSVDAGNQLSAPINVSPGSMYYFAVRAYNSLTEYGPASSEAMLDLRPPTAQITATLGANNVATVTWQTGNATSASINGTGVALSGSTTVTIASPTTFTLTARSATGQVATASASVSPAAAPSAQITAAMGANNAATVTWQTGNATSATINGSGVGLAGSSTITVTGQTTFTLVAKNSVGQTASASATVTPTTVSAPTAQITATLGANNLATVTWQTTNAASAAINGNAVALSGSSSVTVSATTTFTLVGTAADGRTASASATVTVPTQAAPGAPSSMTATISGSRATLGWRAPTGGSSPTGYLLNVGTSSGASNVAANYNVGNVLSVYGDLPRGTYYARVRATNGSGVSGYSNEVRFSIGRKLRKPTGFTVSWTGTTATLSWTASAADGVDEVPTNYVLEAGTSPGASNVATVNVGNTTTFRAEVSSGTYFVRVKAQNELGESDPSEELEIRAPGTPQAPTALMSLGPSGIVDLRWTASAGGYAPTGYVIEAGSAPGRSDLASLRVGNVTRFTTTAPPGVYYVRVRAFNERGNSLPSNEVVVRP